MRVLVVDDSPAVRARLVALIDESSEADVDEAHDGKHAIALAHTLEPDLVVLDLHLGGAMPGLEVLRMLKAASRAPVVIVLTNDASTHHRRLCLSLGADHFFDKSKEFALVADVILAFERASVTRLTSQDAS